MENKIIVVAGPTASGKSDFAVELALKHNGEIISADSRQVYRGLDIGTGKITQEEMKGVPHHMLSVYTPGSDVSVATYAHDANIVIEDILARGKTPIICGGSGHYIDALIYNETFPPVPPDHQLRAALNALSTEELAQRLKEKDSMRYGTIDKHNRRRLIRALEIIETLGSVPAQKSPTLRYPTTIYLMSPTRALLKERITKRLEKRLAHGMIEEVSTVLKNNPSHEDLLRYGIEYVSIAQYLRNECTYEAMKEDIITKSMHYAKRQETWNKKYTDAIIVPIAS